jgi:hypothetical protein
MRDPVDELLVAISHGLGGSMAGSTTDAVEISSFVNSTRNQSIPKTAEAIEGLLWDMEHAGLLEERSDAASAQHDELHRSYALTKEGWMRARQGGGR